MEAPLYTLQFLSWFQKFKSPVTYFVRFGATNSLAEQ